jgi:hypothetical protein
VTSEIDPEVVSDPLPDGRVHRLLHPASALHSDTQGSVIYRVVDPERFVSDPTPDPTFKEVSAPTPDPDPVSDLATLVSASRGLRGKFALYRIREITKMYKKVFLKIN